MNKEPDEKELPQSSFEFLLSSYKSDGNRTKKDIFSESLNNFLENCRIKYPEQIVALRRLVDKETDLFIGYSVDIYSEEYSKKTKDIERELLTQKVGIPRNKSYSRYIDDYR